MFNLFSRIKRLEYESKLQKEKIDELRDMIDQNKMLILELARVTNHEIVWLPRQQGHYIVRPNSDKL